MDADFPQSQQSVGNEFIEKRLVGMYAFKGLAGSKRGPLSPIVAEYSRRDDAPPPPKYILPSDARTSPMKPYISGLRWLKVLGLPMKCNDEEDGLKFVDHARFIKCMIVYFGKFLKLSQVKKRQ